MGNSIHLKLENRIKVCQDYAGLWQTYFQFFADDLAEKQITDEMEAEFENYINVLALNQFKFSELCGDYMKEPEAIMEILTQTVSLTIVQGMPDATIGKLRVEWHKAFIDMHKATGKMLAKLTPKQLEALQQQAAAPQVG